jgi:hypothetical protein
MAPYLYAFTAILSGVVERRFDDDGKVCADRQTFAAFCLSNLW